MTTRNLGCADPNCHVCAIRDGLITCDECGGEGQAGEGCLVCYKVKPVFVHSSLAPPNTSYVIARGGTFDAYADDPIVAIERLIELGEQGDSTREKSATNKAFRAECRRVLPIILAILKAKKGAQWP